MNLKSATVANPPPQTKYKPLGTGNQYSGGFKPPNTTNSIGLNKVTGN